MLTQIRETKHILNRDKNMIGHLTKKPKQNQRARAKTRLGQNWQALPLLLSYVKLSKAPLFSLSCPSSQATSHWNTSLSLALLKIHHI